ncbi:hypothetical protein BG006_007773, partial [Podila minutissima]
MPKVLLQILNYIQIQIQVQILLQILQLMQTHLFSQWAGCPSKSPTSLELTLSKPWYSICCNHGQIQLPEIRPEPRILNMFADAGSAGIYTYRIEGIVTHNIGSLFPKQNLLQLQDILNETNPYCQVYRSIKDREGRTEGMTAEEVEQLKVVLKGARDIKAPRVLQYGKPTAGEIAVLLPTN